MSLPWKPYQPDKPTPSEWSQAEPGSGVEPAVRETRGGGVESEPAPNPSDAKDYRSYLNYVRNELLFDNVQQNHWNLETLKTDAKEAQPVLEALTHSVAESVGGTGSGKLKQDDSIAQKVDGDYLGYPAPIMDLARASITCDSFEQLGDALQQIRDKVEASNGEMEILREKNRFENPTPSGYSDYLMNIRMPNGHIAELQLQHSEIHQHKEAEHALTYEPTREIMRAAQDRLRILPDEERFETRVEDVLTADEVAKLEELRAETQPMYEKAYDAAKAKEPDFKGFRIR